MKQNVDETAGQIVFIGAHPGGRRHPVLVVWSRVGDELDVREQVQAFADEQMWVLGTANATPADVKRFRASQGKSWRHGHWFGRTTSFSRAMATKINAGRVPMRRAA